MIVYTAEDFAQADLATWGRFGVARRTEPSATHQWHVYGSRQGWLSDDEMAADGWEPVVEDAAQERAIAELRHDMSVAQKEMADLRGENDRLERILQDPLLLKGLEAAWKNAEQATECREGDVLATRHSDDSYEVWVAVGAFDISNKTRILSRAPREPWADLADVLGSFAIHDHDGDEYPDLLAQMLYERGVRVVGGDDDE